MTQPTFETMAVVREDLHMVLDTGDQVHLITADQEKATKRGLSNPRFRTFYDVNPLVVAQLLEGKSPTRFLAEDIAWERLAPALARFHSNVAVYERQLAKPTYQAVPPDLPPHLAKLRGELMEAFPQIVDIPTVIELTEIHQAHKHHRPVRTALFRPESLITTWAELNSVDPTELSRAAAAIDHDLRTGGPKAPLDFALAQQELLELHYALKTHGESQDLQLVDYDDSDDLIPRAV